MRVLLLAGTHEARIIAQKIESNPKYFVTVSMAGVTKMPLKFSKNMRFGGFGGQEGLKSYIINNKIDAIIDATHPFAQNITYNAKVVCDDLKISRMLFERPEWVEQNNDKWIKLNTEKELIPYLRNGDIIFVASGRHSAKYFKGKKNISLICRQIDKPESSFPFENGQYLVGRPPFSVESEIKLFKELKISWLLVKNSGGSQSEAKLVAARKLGIKVGILNRPKSLGGLIATKVSEVITWLERL